MKLPTAKEIRELIQTDIRTAIPGAELTVRKPNRKTRKTMAPTRQVKIGRDKATGKPHIDK